MTFMLDTTDLRTEEKIYQHYIYFNEKCSKNVSSSHDPKRFQKI
jgi:hypothetical protein